MVYSFSPTSAGAASTNSIGDWNGQNFNVTLSGTGVNPQFLITPTSLDFGSVQVGTTAPSQTVTVTNIAIAPPTSSLPSHLNLSPPPLLQTPQTTPPTPAP